MSEVLTAVEINCTTGEVIERPLTAEEISAREQSAAQFVAEEAERRAIQAATEEAKASAQAKLAALGLTADEIEALSK